MPTSFLEPRLVRYRITLVRQLDDGDRPPLHYIGEQAGVDIFRAIEAFSDRVKLDMLTGITVYGEHVPYPASTEDKIEATAWVVL